jgi:cysteinyl-tRNA synthetase
MIHLYNSLSGKKELFTPIQEKNVKMYCCGVTPYSNTHLGHSRTFFSYDLLYRMFSDNNYNVQWARNITDVDDKIIKKANDEGCSCSEIVDRYVKEQNEQLSFFNLNRPQNEPKVTENIDQIIKQIKLLIEKDFAYETSTGVYFRVRNFSEYGKLSKNKVDDLRSGSRIEIDEEKEDPLDFVLWKKAKPQEIKWASPFGDGRPGWHIECSAMIHNLFGDSIDVHMGGRDLIFPHHEAEIAQSECATGKQLATYWMHCGMVTLYGEKMSKSTNHFVSIKDFLLKYPPEVLRLTFLSVNYSQPLDFTHELASQNLKTLARIYRASELFEELIQNGAASKIIDTNSLEQNKETLFQNIETLIPKMKALLADDLNSPAAMASLFEFIRNSNQALNGYLKKNSLLSTEDHSTLSTWWPKIKTWLSTTLGLLETSAGEFFKTVSALKGSQELSSTDIQKKIEERNAARLAKDWKKSDEVRNYLLEYGLQLQDTPHGTKWTVVL